MEAIALGDYVLATKFTDEDPLDPWRVGFVVQIIDTWRPAYLDQKLAEAPHVRTYVIGEADGTRTDRREYKHAHKITATDGKDLIERMAAT